MVVERDTEGRQQSGIDEEKGRQTQYRREVKKEGTVLVSSSPF